MTKTHSSSGGRLSLITVPTAINNPNIATGPILKLLVLGNNLDCFEVNLNQSLSSFCLNQL